VCGESVGSWAAAVGLWALVCGCGMCVCVCVWVSSQLAAVTWNLWCAGARVAAMVTLQEEDSVETWNCLTDGRDRRLIDFFVFGSSRAA